MNGKFYDPIGLINDIELDVVGNDDGDTTVFTAVNATLSIAAWNTSKDQFVPAQSAYNCGDDTGETSTGLAVFWNGTGAVAQMRPGPSFIAGLWNVSSAVGVRLVQLTLAPANAFVFVSPGASFNASIAQWVPAASSPIDFYLSNLGTYSLVAELSNFDPSSQALTFAANTTDPISVTLTADPSRGMYTPLYAWSNAQLAAISSAGIGTTSNPYVLYNDQNASFNPEFAQWNDFEFPVFAGIQLVGTSAAVSITPSSLEINYPAWMQAQLTGAGQPSTNELQLLFFLVTNVTIRGAPGISGSAVGRPQPVPDGRGDLLEFERQPGRRQHVQRRRRRPRPVRWDGQHDLGQLVPPGHGQRVEPGQSQRRGRERDQSQPERGRRPRLRQRVPDTGRCVHPYSEPPPVPGRVRTGPLHRRVERIAATGG